LALGFVLNFVEQLLKIHLFIVLMRGLTKSTRTIFSFGFFSLNVFLLLLLLLFFAVVVAVVVEVLKDLEN